MFDLVEVGLTVAAYGLAGLFVVALAGSGVLVLLESLHLDSQTDEWRADRDD